MSPSLVRFKGLANNPCRELNGCAYVGTIRIYGFSINPKPKGDGGKVNHCSRWFVIMLSKTKVPQIARFNLLTISAFSPNKIVYSNAIILCYNYVQVLLPNVCVGVVVIHTTFINYAVCPYIFPISQYHELGKYTLGNMLSFGNDNDEKTITE